MSRSMSWRAIRSLTAPETGEAWLLLLTVSHPQLEVPIRVSSDAVDTTSRGELYVAYPFEMSLPSDAEELARVTLRIDNVGRDITEAIRAISGAPTVALELVLGSQPDVVEVGPLEFRLGNVTYDALQVEGDLTFEPLLDEPFPAHSMGPALFPGLFR